MVGNCIKHVANLKNVGGPGNGQKSLRKHMAILDAKNDTITIQDLVNDSSKSRVTLNLNQKPIFESKNKSIT